MKKMTDNWRELSTKERHIMENVRIAIPQKNP